MPSWSQVWSHREIDVGERGDEYGRQVALAHADTLEQPGNPNTTRLLNILVGVR